MRLAIIFVLVFLTSGIAAEYLCRNYRKAAVSKAAVSGIVVASVVTLVLFLFSVSANG